MGCCIESTPEMGEYSVEVRSESFYLRGEDSYLAVQRHALFVYPNPSPDGRQGTVEILIEDIDKIRACLDAVEAHLGRQSERKRYREALEFYSGDEPRRVVTVDTPDPRIALDGCRVIIDRGQRARCALKGTEPW
jgi:hypothetical protein